MTTEEADNVLAASKIISGSLRWGSRANGVGRLYLEARVECNIRYTGDYQTRFA